jgi:hypothetical protein
MAFLLAAGRVEAETLSKENNLLPTTDDKTICTHC